MLSTKPSQRHSRGNGYIAGAVIAALSVLLALFLLANRQAVIDQVAVWQYQPSSEIAKLAERSGMNETGTFYFYASEPVVEDADSFNGHCDRKEESVAILGCYDGRYIYIYDVVNKQLDGIKETTAAHEMLHVAYARLSEDDKKMVDALLEEEYEKRKDEKEFSERFAFYARAEPGERDNELHSIIATEVSTIDPALEAYYKRYFAKRSNVVALHRQYASLFAELQAKSDQLSAELTVLAAEVNQQTKSYNDAVAALNKSIESFNDRANNGGFEGKEAFDNERSSLIARADGLDTLRQEINAKIARYNSLRDELKSVASQSQTLTESIDSSLAPAPSL